MDKDYLDTPFSNDAMRKMKKLSEGDIIEIPQYENELIVKDIINKTVGIKIVLEFSEESMKNDTQKSLMAMKYGDGIHLHTENSDMGEVNKIDVKN